LPVVGQDADRLRAPAAEDEQTSGKRIGGEFLAAKSRQQIDSQQPVAKSQYQAAPHQNVQVVTYGLRVDATRFGHRIGGVERGVTKVVEKISVNSVSA
jgi:hypothetical protein